MSPHSEIEKKLIQFLTGEKEFPSSSLLVDPPYTNSKNITVRPDVVAVDESTKEPLVIFEVKEELKPDKEGKYITQVLSYSDIDKDRSIPVYLVTGPDSGALKFYKLTETNNLEEVNASNIQTYKEFLKLKLTLKPYNFRKESARTIGKFKILCFIIAFLIFVLLCFDVYFKEIKKIDFITTNRMALIIVSVALLIIPFAQKIKVLGMEYERMREESKNDTEKIN